MITIKQNEQGEIEMEGDPTFGAVLVLSSSGLGVTVEGKRDSEPAPATLLYVYLTENMEKIIEESQKWWSDKFAKHLAENGDV